MRRLSTFVLPSSLCSLRKTNPRQKNASQFFGFAHPPPLSGQENRIDKKKEY